MTGSKLGVVALGINTQGWGYGHGYGHGRERVAFPWESLDPIAAGILQRPKMSVVCRDTTRAGESWNVQKSHQTRCLLELQAGALCWFMLFLIFSGALQCLDNAVPSSAPCPALEGDVGGQTWQYPIGDPARGVPPPGRNPTWDTWDNLVVTACGL